MGSHLSFLFKNFFSWIFYKVVPMSFILKIYVKLHWIADPSHEQIKSVQSSIKINSSLKLHQKLSSPNKSIASQPIGSNQLNLKLWFEINHALETSWKYLSNHVWWCCVKLYLCVLLILLMVDCLQGMMKMGVPIMWKWWVMLTCYCGPWIIHHPQRCMWYWPCKMMHSRKWYIATGPEVWHLGD
jgi:hypothetical protein